MRTTDKEGDALVRVVAFAHVLLSSVLLVVGVLAAAHATVTAMTTVPTTVVTASSSTHHAAHVAVSLHRSAAVAVLAREDNTAKADKDEGDDSDYFLFQLSHPPGVKF